MAKLLCTTADNGEEAIGDRGRAWVQMERGGEEKS
jgi:hypothetical protein